MFKPNKITIIIVLAVSLTIVSMPFLFMHRDSPTSTAFTSVEDPIACYSKAAAELLKSPNARLIVNTYEIVKTKENIFQTAAQQDITYLNRNSGDLQFQAIETIDMKGHTLETAVIYADSALYYTINGTKFTGSYNQATLSAQYPPPIILDADAYESINGLQVGNSTVIRFTSPTGPEGWTGIDAAKFRDAWGSAWIDSSGRLVKSTYNLCYTRENITFYRSVTVRIATLDPGPISIPDNTDDYIQLSNPLLPAQLEIACGYLLQSQNMSAHHTDTITCQIFGDTRLQSIDIAIRDDTQNPFLEMTTTVDITNNGHEGKAHSSGQVQRYDNGNYTLHTDDGSVVTTEEVSSQELLARCQEILIGTILLPHHVQAAEVTHTDNGYRVEFAANDEFAAKIISDACTTLYNEPQLLDELTTEHRIDRILCYIEFSEESGLPVKSGIHFLGTYHVGDLPYHLIFESDQVYHIP